MKIVNRDRTILNIVGNGAMSTENVGEGRIIPIIIIDIEGQDRINDLIEIHANGMDGEVKTGWSRPVSMFTPKVIFMDLNFIKPMQIDFAVAFDLANHWSIINGIVQANALYLQVGKAGDKVSQKISESILVEVPDTGFEGRWKHILPDVLKDKYKAPGRSKKVVKELVTKHIASMREFWKVRRNDLYK